MSTPDDQIAARLQRLHNVIDDLRPMATAGMLGVPFGEGHGLETAMQAAFRHLQSPDDAKRCGFIMGVDLIVSTTDERVPERMLMLMGATPEDADRHGLTGEARSAVLSLGGAAQTILREWEGPGSMWNLWSSRADVQCEMLCWHIVARLRLASAGLMEAVERP